VFLEVGPDSSLGLLDTGVGSNFTSINRCGFECCESSSWAVVDWSSRCEHLVEEFVVPACFEEEDDDHDVEDSESDEYETEHLSTSESSDETFMDGRAAGEGNSGVGVDSDSHTNVTGKDGSD